MSRVEGLAEIVLWVADMEAALDFYYIGFENEWLRFVHHVPLAPVVWVR